jgi:hypothetical protein
VSVTVEVSTRIGRPPTTVFAALIDVDRYPEWLIASGIVRVERLDPIAPLAVGSALRISQTVAGRSTILDGRVTLLEPDMALGLGGKDKDGVTIEINARVAAEDLATSLHWSLRLGLPLRYRMFESMVAPQARRAASLDIEALKRRLESVPAD